MEESKKTLMALGKKLGVRDIIALNDFIDASIFAALEPILERLTSIENQLLLLSSHPTHERVAQISPRQYDFH
jgi:hypothetical protein